MKFLAAFVCGLIFAIGLAVSGMTDANKVIGFLDVFDSWDPTLAFVMVGAIAIHSVAYRLITRRQSPYLVPLSHLRLRRSSTKSYCWAPLFLVPAGASLAIVRVRAWSL